MFSVIAVLVLLEPDMDSTMVLTIIVATVLIAGGIRARHLVALASAVVVLSAGLAMAAPYRRARMFAYLDPWKDKSNTGYQITQSLIAIGSGGLTGVGLGAGRAKWLFLPNAHTDFIFAVIGEELGLLGCLLVVALFGAFAALGTRAALRAPDRFGMLVAAGITAWVVGQAVINIGAVVGLLPVSGIPLPFVSFGGSALVFTMAAAGILANVARHETRTVPGSRRDPAGAPAGSDAAPARRRPAVGKSGTAASGATKSSARKPGAGKTGSRPGARSR
jgi:cell division protein FtsW